MKYADQLKHPMWQRKRLEMLEASDFKCQDCGSDSTTLHVHHKQYVKNRKVWEYSADELIVLCEECHKEEHEKLSHLKQLLCFLTTEEAVSLIAGYLKGKGEEIPDELWRDGFGWNPFAFTSGEIAGASQGFVRYCELEDLLTHVRTRTTSKTES